MTNILDNCALNELCEFRGGSLELCKELVDRLLEWMQLQPHLPQGGDVEELKKRLEYFVVSTKFSLERAKQKLDMYYTIRHLVPELFAERDPLGDDITRLCEIVQYVPLPKLTPDNFRVSILRSKDIDVAEFKPWDLFKYTFMIGEVRITEDCSFGDIWIYDLAELRIGHLTKLTPTLIKRCNVAATKAYSVKIKGIHFINAPSFVDKFVVLLKSIMKPKIAERIHIHSAGIESLYEHVPKSILPVDYGGDEESLETLQDKWRKRLIDWRDWFLTEGVVTANEELRPGESLNIDDLFGFHGSFRKLEVD